MLDQVLIKKREQPTYFPNPGGGCSGGPPGGCDGGGGGGGRGSESKPSSAFKQFTPVEVTAGP